MRNPAAWLLVVLGSGFVLFTAAGVLKVLLEEIPASARPEAIQQRFGRQLEFLRDLAATYPAKECRTDLPTEIESSAAWEKRVDSGAELFSEPVILGASVICYLPNATMYLAVKVYEKPTESFSRVMVLPRTEPPSVSLWYTRERRVIHYEDHVLDSSGVTKGYRLVLDLDRLENH
jgi:hypothetical protein